MWPAVPTIMTASFGGRQIERGEVGDERRSLVETAQIEQQRLLRDAADDGYRQAPQRGGELRKRPPPPRAAVGASRAPRSARVVHRHAPEPTWLAQATDLTL